MKFDILKPQSTSGTGRKAIQEDSVFPALGEGTIHDKLFIVADGHGGEGKGFEASECFCQAVSDYFFQNTCPDEPFTDEMLDEALQNAASAMGRRCPTVKEPVSHCFICIATACLPLMWALHASIISGRRNVPSCIGRPRTAGLLFQVREKGRNQQGLTSSMSSMVTILCWSLREQRHVSRIPA